jgi:hypothetical protein
LNSIICLSAESLPSDHTSGLFHKKSATKPLADVIARVADHPINRIAELLPWNWCRQNANAAA